MRNLVCPLCQSEMKEVAKGGVTIDTCTRCRGVFLDRGELERLSSMIDGPAQSGGFLAGAPTQPAHHSGYFHGRDDDDDDHRDRGRHGSSHHPQKSKMSRLLDFFD